MKRYTTIICGLLAAALVFSCTEKTPLPDTSGDTEVEEAPNPEPEPEPEPEPLPEINPILDIVFQEDGNAIDASEYAYRINTYSGMTLMAWNNPAYASPMVRFSPSAGDKLSDSYYKFNYYSEAKFKKKIEDGYSIEAILMLDCRPDGTAELKAFSSTEQGGTGLMVSASDYGKELTFITNVSPNGSSNWVICRSGIVPERGHYYHVVGVWDKENNEARVYVDGVLKNTIKTNGNFNYPKSAACHWFCVGGDPTTTSVESAWKGDIAAARIYDQALDSEWIRKQWEKTQIPDATFLPENVLYLTTCNIQKGGKFTIAGNGFESSDILSIKSQSGNYSADCQCTANDINIVAELPNDIESGKYRLTMLRNSEIYPLGNISFNVLDQITPLKAPEIIAHRGFHKNGAPENSIAALANAQELKVYGSEVDVWLTTDGVLVCNHDGVLSGMKLQECTYDQVKNLTLTNGEKLPTFEATLEQLAKSQDTKLILEFKGHSSPQRNYDAVDTALAMIDEAGLGHMIEYITTEYDLCKYIVAAKPEAMIGYLGGDRDPATLYADGIMCIDYSYGNLNSHPEWITKAHELGMKVNVWTINSDNDMMIWLGKGVDYITTDNPDRLKVMIDTFCE